MINLDYERCILIRVGEIFLKRGNAANFEKILIQNIKKQIKKFNAKLDRSPSRLYIVGYKNSDEEQLCECISKIFGISSYSICRVVNYNIDDILKLSLEMTPDDGKFRVNVKRADKRIPLTSRDITIKIADYLLDNKKGLSVDLHNYDFIVNVDIRDNGKAYCFFDRLKGQGGLPVGSSGRGMLLLSGGIDSPVAGYLMAKRGMRIQAIHFQSPPYTSTLALEKVKTLARKMSEFTGSIKLHIIDFTELQLAIHKYCDEDYMITIMRRIMVRIAKKIALRNKCYNLVTGESLGQVASQTIKSLITTTDAGDGFLIFRPLIAFDKEETIEIAKKIDTFKTSIIPHSDCCTVFLPKHPQIFPSLKNTIEQEEKIVDLDELINKTIREVKSETIE